MGRIFINYRRGDDASASARIFDRLAAAFGGSNVFMDVDRLSAGQRFDKELEKALADSDVFLSVIGPKWMDLFAERHANTELDYVREEIAGALKRGIIVIPVLIERTPLPRADALPDDIRELVLHQKHEVSHERFGKDIEGLIDAIKVARKATSGGSRPTRSIKNLKLGWFEASVILALVVALYFSAEPSWRLFGRPMSPEAKHVAETDAIGSINLSSPEAFARDG